MLRGISNCLCGIRVPTKHQFPGHPRHPSAVYTLLLKDFSSAGAEHGEVSEKVVGRFVDQSLTATHCVPDGRRFEFATVMVKEMRKGESPLRIWEQARALIGGHVPTLAVAFVSKPTQSALRAVRILAGQLSAGGKIESKQSPPSPFPKSCFENFPADATTSTLERTSSSETSASSHQSPTSSSLSAPFAPSSPNLIGDCSGATEVRQDLSIPREALSRDEHVPLIGCIMEDLGGELDNSDVWSSKFQVSPHGSSSGMLQIGSQLNGGYNRGFRLGSSVPALDPAKMDGEDEDGEEDTLSDWENLCSEYGEEAIKVLDANADSEDDEENCPEDQVSKEGLVSFVNALVSCKNPSDESGQGGDLRALEGREQNAVVHNREVEEDLRSNREAIARAVTGDALLTEPERCLDSTGLGFQHRHYTSHEGLGGNSLFGDVEGTITVEPRTEGSDKAGVSDSDIGKEDVNYKLLLCVGHMPGAKAFAFHSSTTGLPRFPDLENAVTENNPHMLLLGAPGFVFPDFIQRLATVFPASCRAGAFLAPLFFSKQSQWTRVPAEKESGPLFFGTHLSTSGVVGLAISTKDKRSQVPVGAFAEFARMSVGMPRIRGYIFLDETISKHLFLPKNVSLRNFSGSPKGNVVAPSSVLDQLRRQLLKESAVPLHSKDLAADRRADGAKDSTGVDGASLSWQFLSSSPGKEELRPLERLPLALFDAVLFPGWSTPFYVFEPCYRVMVRQCVEQGKPFGLSSSYSATAVESGEVIGTIANLKVHSLERDCRSYIIAHGIRRFRVVKERIWSEPGSFGLTMGQVQFFDDKECATVEEKEELLGLAKRAVSLCCEVILEAQLAPGLVNSAHDPRLASFAIGHVLDVPTRVKRRWLKMVNTKARLLEQITFLETKVPTTS